MTAQPDVLADTDPITVTLDPRVAYAGIGPDDGDLADTARALGVADALEDLADAAGQLDHVYQRAWAQAAQRVAPDLDCDVQAAHHQPVDERPLSGQVATAAPPVLVGSDVLDAVTAGLAVQVDADDPGRTRWIVTDNGALSGSASAPWTVRSIQDRHTHDLAVRIADDGDLLRDVDHDGLTLRLYAPTGDLPADRDAIGYVLTDGDAVMFASTDFRPSPLHAVDSDATVEALAEFLALRPGDTDDEFFSTYTLTQLDWIDGDGPDRLHDLIAALPGETEWSLQQAAAADLARGPIGLWTVTPTDRTDLPSARLLADRPGNARAQYPAYVAAWLADTDHYADLDDDLFPTLDARIAEPDGRDGVRAVSPVRGQHTLDWAVEHVNHWEVRATVPVGTVPADVVLDVPATGCATVAMRNAQAVAHAGAAVDAHRRARVTALPGSQVNVHPGACIDRRPGSTTHLVLPPGRRLGQDGTSGRRAERAAQR